MRSPNRQRGVALFSAVFLIVVIAAVAAAFALTTTTQQRSSARALDAEGAYAAANGSLDVAIALVLNGDGGCGSFDEDDLPDQGYDLDLDCEPPPDEEDESTIQEGGEEYLIYELKVTASRGDRRSGTLVRRTVQAQVTDAD